MPCLNMQQDQTATPLISRQVTRLGVDLALNIWTPTTANDLQRAGFSTRLASIPKPNRLLKLYQNFLLLLLRLTSLLNKLHPEPQLWGGEGDIYIYIYSHNHLVCKLCSLTLYTLYQSQVLHNIACAIKYFHKPLMSLNREHLSAKSAPSCCKVHSIGRALTLDFRDGV